MKRNLLRKEEDSDPMSVVSNLFDVAMVFAVALMVALVTRYNMTEMFSQEDFTMVKNPGKENMEIITKEGQKINRYTPSEDQDVKSGKKGKKVGIAYELDNGEIITGKTSNLLGASAALLLNALKHLANLADDIHMISPEAIEPIQTLKTRYLGSKNPRLHTDEVLIALSISAANDPVARLALEQIPKLKGCQVHTSVMLSSVDTKMFKKLGIQLTSESKKENTKIYQ